METGIVLTGRNNIFTVEVGELTLLCRLRGKRLEVDERSYNPLAPGDIVEVGDLDPLQGTAVIERRVERRNSFLRFNTKRGTPQTLAANIDEVICITSILGPVFNRRFLDRFLVLAEDQGVPASLIVNKSDLDEVGTSDAVAAYRSLGYPAFAICATDRSGIELVREHIGARLVAVVGQSGVGKSTLLNALMGQDAQQVGEVSQRYQRGKHTTNAARLVSGASLRIIDTPGVQDLEIRTVRTAALAWCFREFRDFIPSCRHTNCTHEDEQGCHLRDAVSSGKVELARYETYLKFRDELLGLQSEA